MTKIRNTGISSYLYLLSIRVGLTCLIQDLVQKHVKSRGNSVVKICHLYENVQNRPQNKKKVNGVLKWVSKPSYQAKFKMAATN